LFRRTSKSLATLALVGCLLLLLSGAGLYFQHHNKLHCFIGAALAQGAIYLSGVWLVLRERRDPGALILVLLIAGLLRIGALVMPPYLSDDIYRYVWDGRVQAAGINPYRFVPNSAELKSLRDGEIFPKMNRSGYARTIYPPVAQGIFFVATRLSESVTWMKMVMLGFETMAVWLLVRLLLMTGLPAERVLIYAWNPLTVWEFAGSGHIDAAAIAFLVLALWARRRSWPALTGIALACATLIKLYPALIFPALYRRWDWKMPAAFAATVLFGYLPFAEVGRGVLGFLPGYIKEEGLVSGTRFYSWNLIQRVWPVPWFDGVCYLALLLLLFFAVAAWLTLREQRGVDDFLVHALVLAALATVLFSPHYCWYFAWLLPLLVFVPYLPLLYLTFAAFVLYESRLNETSDSVFWSNSLLYLPFVVLVAAHWVWRRSRWQIERSARW
jgi:hypothetical protein